MKTIPGNKVIYTFSPTMEAIEIIQAKDIITVECNDCFFQQITKEEQIITEIDYDKLNPATGPVYVEGAESGDILKVKILNIEVGSKGVAAAVPGEGVLGDQVKKSVIRVIDIENGYALFKDVKIPIEPMIGVIGVAPAQKDGSWPTETPWKHGGNMDTTDIKAGSILYLPINQKGALLGLGDCHAVMGDGEISFTGLEIPAQVVLEIDVIKNKSIEWPILETEDHTLVVASGDDLEQALYHATDQVVKLLKNALNISWEDAYILSSLSVDLKISQVVDPKKTVRAAIPKSVVNTQKILDALQEKSSY